MHIEGLPVKSANAKDEISKLIYLHNIVIFAVELPHAIVISGSLP